MKKKVLDVTDYKCPMTFLKTKEFIKLNINHKKIILLKGKKDLELLKNSLEKKCETPNYLLPSYFGSGKILNTIINKLFHID